jgi:hypothetical protein
MRLAYHSITWGGVVGDATGVTSVKDLYYRAYGSMEQAIRAIGAAGYEGTEMFDGNVATYADRPDDLRERGHPRRRSCLGWGEFGHTGGPPLAAMDAGRRHETGPAH